MKNIIPYLLVLVLAALLRLPFLTREFVLEEALHVKVIRALSETGYPLIYPGEPEPLTIFMDRSPVLFLFFIPLFKLLGESELSVRLTPLLFSLGEIFLVMYFARRLFTKHKTWFLPLCAGLFLAVHPYMVISSLQIHFDNGILTFFTSLLFLFSLMTISQKSHSRNDYFKISLAVFFVFAIKIETALISIAIISLFALIYSRAFVKRFLLYSLLSLLLFSGLFYLYNSFFGHPEQFWVPTSRIIWVFEKIFLPKYTTFALNTQTRHFWADNYYLLIRFISWLSLPTILIAIYAFLRIFAVKRFIPIKSGLKNNQVVFLLLWFSLYSSIFLLGGWAGDFPRYFAPTMPALSLLLASVIHNDLHAVKKKVLFKILLISAIFSLGLLVIFNSQGFLFLDHITGWIPDLQTPFFALFFLSTSLILIFINHQRVFLLCVLLFLNLGQMTAQNIHNMKSEYSLTNFYGHSGFREAANFLRKKFPDNKATIYTFDPVGYYWQGSYFDHYQLGPHPQRHPLIISAFTNKQVRAVALPLVSLEDLTSILKQNNIDFAQYQRKYLPHFINISGENGIYIWYQ